MEEQSNLYKDKMFESLKKFFASDMKIKEVILKLAPTEIDDYSEESRIEYTDRLYKELQSLETRFNDIVKGFGFDETVSESIKMHFAKIREKFLIEHYEPGVIKEIYKTCFSNMDERLIEEVKENLVGYTINRASLSDLINKSVSINELLHIMHSYIINNEKILEAMPVIATKDNEEHEPITLRGEENELSRKLFEQFPLDLDCGCTDIVSMENKVLMMIRDRGHALTIDIDASNKDHIMIRYFVPKICNKDMIKALPGIGKITDSGAVGNFETSREEFARELFDFIGRVPTDLDMSPIQIPTEVEEIEDISEPIFSEEEAKELAIEANQDGRRIGTLRRLQEALKNAKNILNIKIKGIHIGENSDDRENRD